MVSQIQLGDLTIEVVFKEIKNVHLSVHPPAGRVSIAAPMRLSLDTVRVFAISKLDWIRTQQKKIREQERETEREYLDRESHHVWGKRYLLSVIERDEPPAVELKHARLQCGHPTAYGQRKRRGSARGVVSGAGQAGDPGTDRHLGAEDDRVSARSTSLFMRWLTCWSRPTMLASFP